jgi:hypothetical protein
MGGIIMISTLGRWFVIQWFLIMALGVTGVWILPAAAQEVPQSGIFQPDPPTLRTVEEMQAADLTAPQFSAPTHPFNMPTISASQLEALKAQGESLQAPGGKPGVSPEVPGPAVPGVTLINCIGQTQAGWIPPDTHGAVGSSQFVQVTNSNMRVWNKSAIPLTTCPTILLSVSLNSLMGYFTEALFDPRVVWDPIYGRFVVTAEAFQESATVQYHFIAVSKGGSASAGAWWIYKINVGGIYSSIYGTSIFFDYPQLGYDEDAVIITANLFSDSGYVGSTVLFLNKHRLYDAKPTPSTALSYCYWWGGPLNYSTIAPNISLDRSTDTWLSSAPVAGASIRFTKWSDTSRICGEYEGGWDVAVPGFGPPPNAPQFGSAITLDTSDSRFVNAGTEKGLSWSGTGELWQAHTTNDFGFATPRYYRFSLPYADVAPTLLGWNHFFASGSSYDFNASIAHDKLNHIYLTWSSTNPAAAINAQVRGGVALDCCPFTSGFTVFTSPSPLVGNGSPVARWGDYSAVTVDPTVANRAWATNETIASGGGSWQSRIFKMLP